MLPLYALSILGAQTFALGFQPEAAQAIVLPQDDFGDAPSTYPTLLSDNGARHFDDGVHYLGSAIDTEADGQPSVGASDDDTIGIDDEDGLTSSSFVVGGSSSLTVTASTTGYVNAFLDINQDGDWQDYFEHIVINQPMISGSNVLAFILNGSTLTGSTYLRVRYSSAGSDFPFGAAGDGEVEDYTVTIGGGGGSSSSSSFSSSSSASYSSSSYSSGTSSTSSSSSSVSTTSSSSSSSSCTFDDVADVNSDGIVDNIDLAIMNGNWDLDVAGGKSDGDLNLDGHVDISDLAILGAHWHETICPPSSSSSSSSTSDTSSSSSSSTSSGSSTSSSSSSSSSSFYVDPYACDGLSATVYVNTGGIIVGGPQNGNVYAGVLTGTFGSDVIVGTDGNDEIYGLTGHDVICGKAGDDEVHGGIGNDAIFGGDDDDRLHGGLGNDRLYGGEGKDVLFGEIGNDKLYGNEGRDRLYGGWDNDEIYGGDGKDIILGDIGNDYIEGGNGDDAIFGGFGNDEIHGGDGTDILSGGFNNDELHGGADGDFLFGGFGNDEMHGDDGEDRLWGGPDNDDLFGGPGADILRGELGNDTLEGNGEADVLCGSFGNDTLKGNAQDDQLDGGLGTDDLNGNGGADICINGETLNNCEDTVSAVSLCGPDMDYGDAPDSYQTTDSVDGARHLIIPGIFLGPSIDAEGDGQPSVGADGDDLGASDDEDGVTFTTPFTVGSTGSITVNASTSGYLDAWIDFDADGSFDEPTDRIFTDEPLVSGDNTLAIAVTPSAPVDTYARFRFSTNGGLDPAGFAFNGEVEDYVVSITNGSSSSSSSSSTSSGSSTSSSSSSSSSTTSSSSSSSIFEPTVVPTNVTGDANNGNAKHRGSQTNVINAALNYTFRALGGVIPRHIQTVIAPGAFGGGPVTSTFSRFAPGGFGGGPISVDDLDLTETERTLVCRTRWIMDQEIKRQNALVSQWAASLLANMLGRTTDEMQLALEELNCGTRRAPNLGDAAEQ